MTLVHPWRFLLLCGAAAIVLRPVHHAAGAAGNFGNVLLNPGFESGALSPWFQDRIVVDEGTDWAVTSLDSKSGLYSAWVDDNKELRQNFAPVPGSEVVEISFWGKHTESGATETFFEVFFSDGTSVNKNQQLHTTHGIWTKIDVTNYVNPSKFVTGVSVYGNTNSRFFLDDFVVRVVPEPAASALYLSAITAICIVQRRRDKSSKGNTPSRTFAAISVKLRKSS